MCSLVWVGPRDSRRRGKHLLRCCTAKLVGPRTNNMFISPQRQSCEVVHFVTPTELRRRSLHHTDRVAKTFISSHRQRGDQTLMCLQSQASPHKHVCSFHQHSTAHGAWMKPHMMKPELMASTSRLPLKEKMKTSLMIWERCSRHIMCSSLNSFPRQIRERCGRHVVCPRSTPFPSREWCGSHIMCPRSTPFPDSFGRGAADTSCVLAQLLSQTVSGEVQQTHHVSSLNSFPRQFRERCGRHIMCPRSTPFPDSFGRGAADTSCVLAQLLSQTVSGEVRQPHHVASHSSFPGPAYL